MSDGSNLNNANPSAGRPLVILHEKTLYSLCDLSAICGFAPVYSSPFVIAPFGYKIMLLYPLMMLRAMRSCK